jgi:hypothetical protein
MSMASAQTILEQYRNGERAPVSGPLTYEEALLLTTINEKLTAALQEQLSLNEQELVAPDGISVAHERQKAHYTAYCLLAEAEAL